MKQKYGNNLWGQVPLCNGMRDRAPIIGDFCFPLCWRCTMIIIGALTVWAFNTITGITGSHLMVGILLNIPIAIDGIRQYYFSKMSNNYLRAITGFLCGVGVALL